MARFNAATARTIAPAPEIITTPGFTPVIVPPPETPPPSPAAPAAAKPAAKPKLNFGGIQKKATVAVPKSEYPVLPDPEGNLAEHAAAFLEAHAAEEAAKGAKEAARFELVKASRPFHFTVNSGLAEVPSSVSVLSPRGEVRVSFKDAYKKLNETQFEAVQQLIGTEVASAYLTQTFAFTVKSESIPEAKMQAVIDAMRKMAEDIGIGDAIEVATCYKPTAEWHTARFRRLTPEQNIRLETLVDSEKGYCTAAVSPARGGRK